MAENISISLENLERQIEDLKIMKNDWVSTETQRKSKIPETSGGGNSINVLESIIQEYGTIHNSLIVLIENTIQFLENMRKSMETADQNAAEAIKGE